MRGLHWWLSHKESACQCERTWLNPRSRKIPQVKEQRGLYATTTEPVLWSPRAAATEPTRRNYWSLKTLEPVPHNKKSHRSEKSMHCIQRAAPARQNLRKAHRATKTQQINKEFLKTVWTQNLIISDLLSMEPKLRYILNLILTFSGE